MITTYVKIPSRAWLLTPYFPCREKNWNFNHAHFYFVLIFCVYTSALDLNIIRDYVKLNPLDLANFPSLEDLTLTDANIACVGSCKTLKKFSLNMQGSNNKNPFNLDLKAFPNIDSFSFEGDKASEMATTISITHCNARSLQIDSVGNIEIQSLKLLEHLSIYSLKEPLKEPSKINLPPNLKMLKIKDAAHFQTLFANDLSQLEELILDHVEIDLSQVQVNLPNLKRLTVRDSKITGMDKLLAPNLESITIKNNDIKDKIVTIENLTHLKSLIIEAPKSQLIIKNCLDLKKLDVEHDGLTVINCPNIFSSHITKAENQSAIRPQPSYNPLSTASSIGQALHQKNEANLVTYADRGAHVSLNAKLAYSDYTGVKTGNITITLFANEEINKHHYRVNVINCITKDSQNKFDFNRVLVDPKIIPPTATTLSLPDLVRSLKRKLGREELLGHFSGTISPREHYALGALGALSEADLLDFYVFPEGTAEIVWDKKLQQAFVKLKDGTKHNQEVTVLYKVKQNRRYDYFMEQIKYNEIPKIEIEQSKQNLLDTNIRSGMDEKLRDLPSDHPLAFMKDDNISVKGKIYRLSLHCLQFSAGEKDKPEKLLTTSTDELDQLWGMLTEENQYSTPSDRRYGKGVCRHRACAFMLMAHYLNVPVQMLQNEQHQYCEIPTVDDKGHSQWMRVDLSGAPTLDKTIHHKQSIFEKIPEHSKKVDAPKPKQSQQKKLKQTPDRDKKPQITLSEDPISYDPIPENPYLEYFLNAIAEGEIPSAEKLLTDEYVFAPVIALDAQQSPFAVNRQILEALHNQDSKHKLPKKHIYIHCPEDLNAYLYPWKLVNGAYQQDEKDGPLKKLISEGGVLVINWNNFSPTEIASYKSLMDKPPALLKEAVSSKVLVVGLIDKNNSNCAAFTTRTKLCRLTSDYLPPVIAQPLSSDKTNLDREEVDLFSSISWRSKLLGSEIPGKNGLELTKGPLIIAIEKNRPITIYNPPDDEDFTLLLERLREEKTFFFDGKMLPIPSNFKVTVAEKSHTQTDGNVQVKEELPPTKRTPIRIGLYNYYECFSRMRFEDSKGQPLNSFLTSYDENKHYFYFTESIAAGDWEEFIATKNLLCPSKKIDIYLAPGVTIGSLPNINKLFIPAISIAPNAPIPEECRIFTTNDPDYFCEQFTQNKNNIIEVNENTQFSDLIYKVSLDKTGKFIFEEKGLLKKLIAGEKVILNGQLSPTLYHQLLPFLAGDKKVEINGKEVEISGKLYVVLPNEHQLNLNILPHSDRQYTTDYYRAVFASEKELFEKLLLLLDWDKKITHLGLGIPGAFEPSFHRYQRMLHALKNDAALRQAHHEMKKSSPVHGHNPLKGLWHYDFPKTSTEYSIISVLTKKYFDRSEQAFISFKKLHKLRQRYPQLDEFSVFKKYVWEVLNCCNGPMINKLLADVDLEALKQSSLPLAEAMSKLPPNILQNIHAAIIKASPQKFEDTARVSKQERQLKQLIENDEHVIFIKGRPGDGKTYTVRNKAKKWFNEIKNKEVKIYQAHELKEYLNDNTDTIKILQIDEANKAQHRYWDFLKGISLNRKELYYDGEFYSLGNNANRYIIATGNFESDPGREHHPFLQTYAETLIFQKPDLAYLSNDILNPLLEPYQLNDEKWKKTLIYATSLIEDFNPHFKASIRDLENLAQRFIVLAKEVTLTKEQALYLACVTEFGGAIKDKDDRAQFAERVKNFISPTLPLPPPRTSNKVGVIAINENERYYISMEKAYLLDALEQDLLMREHMIENSSQNKEQQSLYYKSLILVEGEAGVGKSRLLKEIVTKRKRELIAKLDPLAPDYLNQKQSIEDSWRYHVINPGNPALMRKQLEEIYDKGEIAIIEEFNLDETLEDFLIQLEEKTPKKSGFMILASQNPASYEGRMAVSPAMKNRSHLLYMDTFQDYELVALANAQGLDGERLWKPVK